MTRPNPPDSGSQANPFAGTVFEQPWRWADDRFQLDDLVDFVRHKEVPLGGDTIWYYFGGVTLFFFLIQIATGILLLMYYQPGEATSYESMKHLVGRVPFGWLIRSIHCWSAHLMIISLLVHMLSVFFTKAYRKPREITWFTGLGLLGLALTFGFSGYLLPWNELAFFATAVGTDSVKSIPVVGQWLLEVMRGGPEVTINTLYRFFALHVCILPLATAGLVGLHLILVQRQGMSEPIPHEREGRPSGHSYMRFFPNFTLRDLLLWVFCLNLLAILAVWLPFGPHLPGMEWELGAKANPLAPAYPGIKPEWYFLWVYQLLKEFPAHFFGLEGPQACLLFVNLMLGAWALIPLLDRAAAHNRLSPAFTDFGVGVVLFLLFLMFKAWDLGVPAPRGTDPSADPVSAHEIARNAALAVIALGAVVDLFRLAFFKSKYFYLSALVLLQAALHGLFGLSYLAASGICTALLFAVLVGTVWRRPPAAAAALLLALLLGAFLPAPAKAEAPAAVTGAVLDKRIPPEQWPASFKNLFQAKQDEKPVLNDKASGRFLALPGHIQELVFKSVDSGLLSSPVQLQALLELDVDDKQMALLMTDNCVLCHTNPDQQDESTLFRPRPDPNDQHRYLDLREVVSDVHVRSGLMCSGCHGGAPTDTAMSDAIYSRWPKDALRKTDRTWIPGFCTERCHANPEFMRQFNPGLPVDQMLKYRESKHGQLLLGQHDSKAAQCLSCHGLHGIRRPSSPLSKVNPLNIVYTCGKCHADPEYMKGYTKDDGKTPLPTNQLALYKTSVHGQALLERHDLGAPACNNCHGNHAAVPPQVSNISRVCRTCHVNNGALFDGSKHKDAFDAMGWPECETCHGNHAIQKPSDDMLGTGPKSVCKDCHLKYANPVCNQTADYFYSSVVFLGKESDRLNRQIQGLEEKGMQVDELNFTLAELKDSLVQERSLIHSFSRTEFGKAADEGNKVLLRLQNQVVKQQQEYRYRRAGLLISTLIITIFGVLLYLKIRQVDQAGGIRKK
jgi:cytochrome b6